MAKKNAYERLLSRLANLETRIAKAGKPAISSQTTSGVQVVSRKKRRPGRRKRNRGSNETPVYVESGMDIVHTSSLPSGSKVGTPVLRLPLSPFDCGGTRWNQVGKLWDRWRPISFELEVSSNASMTTAGQITVGWSADQKEQIPKGTNAVTKVAAMVPSVTFHVGHPQKIALPVSTLTKWYQTDTDDMELRTQGVLFVVVSGDLASTIGNVSLTFTLHWKCEFTAPNLPSESSHGGLPIHCEEGYENYFTDSSSDWQGGTKLTFKHKEGGAIVPFPGALTGVVYKIESDAHCQYYKADGTTKVDCPYACRIWDYSPYPALCVFDTWAKASQYSTSGDPTKCLTYTKAGPWVTPDNPLWTPSDSGVYHLTFPGPSKN